MWQGSLFKKTINVHSLLLHHDVTKRSWVGLLFIKSNQSILVVNEVSLPRHKLDLSRCVCEFVIHDLNRPLNIFWLNVGIRFQSIGVKALWFVYLRIRLRTFYGVDLCIYRSITCIVGSDYVKCHPSFWFCRILPSSD